MLDRPFSTDGARYDAHAHEWTPLPPYPGHPIFGAIGPAVWTGDALVVGGHAWDRRTEVWMPLPWLEVPEYAHLAPIWTGTSLLEIGALGDPAEERSWYGGARLDPA